MPASTLHLPDDLTERLDRLARRLARSPDHVAAQAITEHLDREEWQLAEIEAGLAEAERGDFASVAEVKTLLESYGIKMP